MITIEIIADSISPLGKRITTLKLRYPKFIHSEFMTHRMFSRNASSSRAIPVRKLVQEVREDALRAAPVWWGREQKGMASGDELDIREKYIAKELWKQAALNAVGSAGALVEAGVHKSIVNRILEPFSHINVVVTATEWDNFFGLRLDKDAQPEMRVLAEDMWHAMKKSTPKELDYGQWHLPFITPEDCDTYGINDNDDAIKVCVARCARVSYESFETGKKSTFEEDLALFERLKAQAHWSPFEHPAMPDTSIYNKDKMLKIGIEDWNDNKLWYYWPERGNFVGWRQYRKMMEDEAVKPLPEQYR